MKKNIFYFVVSLLLVAMGCLFFLYQESWIVFSFPQKQSLHALTNQQKINSKEVSLWIWNNRKILKKETTEIMYGQDITQNIKILLNNWFLFLEEEGLTDKQIFVQSVALSPAGHEAFISLNQYPFDKSASTFQKLMLIESLLKTLQENKIPITAIRLLVHHQPLQDDHLNFDTAWPIQGYLE
ncbi:MAG TPA: hypothetical protein VLG50_02050 [Candidatus Saccharimonadales bacterium]|nr:hypothetical protein [Candidatus Saccharimonadales bacterium]